MLFGCLMNVYQAHACYLWEPEDSTEFLRTVITVGIVNWELNPNLLKEQPVFSATKLPLQLPLHRYLELQYQCSFIISSLLNILH